MQSRLRGGLLHKLKTEKYLPDHNLKIIITTTILKSL